jgi:eukaryotic-like serine/threonine-protein kinase
VSIAVNESANRLKMVPCAGCGARSFITNELAPFETVPCSKCGHPLMLPVMMQHFELQSFVAAGGMGAVYSAYDTMLQRVVAIKLMKRELAEDKEAYEAFFREARACASLNHQNIIHIYHFGEFEGQLLLVMELANNGSLDSRIEKEGRVPELAVLDIGIKMAQALASALKKNLLHRDIKPGNILFDQEGEPKLVDFGLARSADSETEMDTAIFGTPYYVAPERIKREVVNWSSDLYSLGGTLYHALTGHVPFEAPTPEDVVAAHVHTMPTAPNLVAPDITQETSEAIMATLSKDPGERFQSYDEFRMALEAARTKVIMQRYHSSADEEIPEAAGKGKSWWRR